MEERATVGCIWYVLSFLSKGGLNKLSVVTNILFPALISSVQDCSGLCLQGWVQTEKENGMCLRKYLKDWNHFAAPPKRCFPSVVQQFTNI